MRKAKNDTRNFVIRYSKDRDDSTCRKVPINLDVNPTCECPVCGIQPTGNDPLQALRNHAKREFHPDDLFDSLEIVEGDEGEKEETNIHQSHISINGLYLQEKLSQSDADKAHCLGFIHNCMICTCCEEIIYVSRNLMEHGYFY
jgi:hypothetical protein